MGDRLQKLAQRVSAALTRRVQAVSPRMMRINVWSIAITIALAVLSLTIMDRILGTYTIADNTNVQHEKCTAAANELQDASDYLTDQAQLYVSSGDRFYLEGYLTEFEERDRRGEAVKELKELAASGQAVNLLNQAIQRSDDLAKTELYAMRLRAEADGLQDMPASLAAISLAEADAELDAAAKQALATKMVNGEDYLNKKLQINTRIRACSSVLVSDLNKQLEDNDKRLEVLARAMRISVIALVSVVGFIIVSNAFLILWPMSVYEQLVREDKPLIPSGARELRHLSQAYNEMYETKSQNAQILSEKAKTDPLTGALNRGAFDTLLSDRSLDQALLLVDVDYFKQFNDDYGHDVGDAVLIEVAATLSSSFRSNDSIFRIGGDEFAVIMTHSTPQIRDVIARKLDTVADFLRDTSNGLPSVTISVGIAFKEEAQGDTDFFRAADAALYETKRRGRDGYTFFMDM